MTWYETEQIYHHVQDISEALDQWSMDNAEMRSTQAQLAQLQQKLSEELNDNHHSPQNEILHQVLQQTQQCQRSIRERLKR